MPQLQPDQIAAEGQTEAVIEQGYDIDRAYAEADRHVAGSDAWHYWMDEAKRLEKLHRKGAPLLAHYHEGVIR